MAFTRGSSGAVALLLMLTAMQLPRIPGIDTGDAGEDDDAFDWFSHLQGTQIDGRSEEGVAQALVMMAALKAASASIGEEDGIMKMLVEEAAAGTHALAGKLSDTLGAEFASFQESDIGGAGRVHLNLGSLLELTAEQLDARLAAAAESLQDAAKGQQQQQVQGPTPTAEDEAGDASSGANGTAGRRLHAMDVFTDTTLLRNGTVTITAADTPPLLQGKLAAALEDKLSQISSLGGSLDSLLGVDWAALQSRVQDSARKLADKAINQLPRIKGFNRLEQIFQVVTDRLTGGEGLGQGCTPYVFNGGGNRLPETILFPSFSISQTTGNCVLIPELIGNTEYPGQWSLVNTRVACLGPSTEYLLLPAFYRSAATASEAFTCPTCRNDFSIGPTFTVTLVGDSAGVVRYRNKAEFLAALKTNKTFGWGKEGLHGTLRAVKSKLQERQGVFAKYFGGAGDEPGRFGLVGGLASWVGVAWDKWQQAADGMNSKQMRNLLQQQEQEFERVVEQVKRDTEQAPEGPEEAEEAAQKAAGAAGGHEWRAQLNKWLQEAADGHLAYA